MSTDLVLVDRQEAMRLMVELEQAGAIDDVSLNLTDRQMPFERWQALMSLFGSIDRRTRWYIGDGILFGEDVYGELAAQAADDKTSRYDLAQRVTGLDPGTLKNITSICNRVPKERRRGELGFWIHAEVTSLEPDEQTHWLQRAVEEGWGREELRKEIRGVAQDPATPGADSDSGEHLTVCDRIEAAVRRCFHQAQIADNGDAIVPAEPWAVLTAALGEERD